jgi:hypothetical protein
VIAPDIALTHSARLRVPDVSRRFALMCLRPFEPGGRPIGIA